MHMTIAIEIIMVLTLCETCFEVHATSILVLEGHRGVWWQAS